MGKNIRIGRWIDLTEQEIKKEITEKLDDLAREIKKDNHVEIHRAANGIKVYSVKKRIVR